MNFLKSFLLAASTLCSAAKQTNILWIVTDDQRSDSLACVNQATHGKSESPLGFVSSPEIDALAKEGTLFTHAYCNSPGCVPSRVSMLTGRYPHRNGTYGFKQSHTNTDFCKPTFPEVLRDAGYHTARFGKSGSYIFEWGPGLTWTEPKFYDHVVDKKNDLQRNNLTDFYKDKVRQKGKVIGTAEIYHFPNDRTEKVITDTPSGELTPEQQAHIKSIDKELDIIRAYTRQQTTMIIGGRSSQPANETLDGHIQKAFSNYLTTQKSEKPLFLNLGFHFPHSPVLPPQEFRDLFAGKNYQLPDFSREELKKLPPQLVTLHAKMQTDGLKPEEKQQAIRDYYAFCAYGDSLIGKAVKTFRSVSEKANREWLVVIACGDHGWHLGEQGIEAKFGPYEMSNRCSVVTLSSNKKLIPVQTSKRFIEFVDFAATFLHAAGVDLNDPKHDYFDGQSLISQANNKLPERDYVIGEMNHVYGPRAYLRSRDFAFSMRTRPNKKGSDFKWGLTTKRENVELSLFDLRSDPNEQNNLANDSNYIPLADWFRAKLGNIVLGDGRVEADWSKENSYTQGNFAKGSHDHKLDIPIALIPQLEEEWTDLFATNDLSQWWTDKKDREGVWTVKDGVASRGKAKAGGLTSKVKLFNFELTFEWNIAEGGNSGIKYRGGLEYQLLDDAHHIRGKTPNSSVASLYDLVAPSADKPSKPAGQWNTGRIFAQDNHIEHWMNGKKVLEIEQGSDDWKARLQKSKFKDKPDFGTKASSIHLQDHGANVHFRKVLLR